MSKVSEKTNIPAGALKKATSVSNSNLIIKVSYSNSDKEKAQEIAQTIIDTAQEVANSTKEVDGVTKPVYHLLYENLTPLSAAKAGVKVSHTMRNTAIGDGACEAHVAAAQAHDAEGETQA